MALCLGIKTASTVLLAGLRWAGAIHLSAQGNNWLPRGPDRPLRSPRGLALSSAQLAKCLCGGEGGQHSRRPLRHVVLKQGELCLPTNQDQHSHQHLIDGRAHTWVGRALPRLGGIGEAYRPFLWTMHLKTQGTAQSDERNQLYWNTNVVNRILFVNF